MNSFWAANIYTSNKHYSRSSDPVGRWAKVNAPWLLQTHPFSGPYSAKPQQDIFFRSNVPRRKLQAQL
jgi:hypothetical protein